MAGYGDRPPAERRGAPARCRDRRRRQHDMEAAAIDGLLAGGVKRHFPEVLEAKAHLFRGKTGYDAAIAVTARPCDIADLHARVLQRVRADLTTAAGVGIGGLELEVDRFVLEDRGES